MCFLIYLFFFKLFPTVVYSSELCWGWEVWEIEELFEGFYCHFLYDFRLFNRDKIISRKKIQPSNFHCISHDEPLGPEQPAGGAGGPPGQSGGQEARRIRGHHAHPGGTQVTGQELGGTNRTNIRVLVCLPLILFNLFIFILELMSLLLLTF